MDREDILNSVPDLTAEQLSEFINAGTVSLNELQNTGTLDRMKRRRINEILEEQEREVAEAWENAEFGTEDDLTQFIQKYPNSSHAEEAGTLVTQKRAEKEEQRKEKDHILKKISSNPNHYRRREINRYLDDGVISKSDLLQKDIPEKVVDLLGVNPSNLELGETPEAIPDGYTEVYFWGTKGSGKTAALSAILGRAEREGNLEIAKGPGYHYAFQLKNIFANDSYAVMPQPTSVEKTQYLPFSIRKNSRKTRSISLIEISGEIFECFYNENAGLEQKSGLHQNTFNVLLNYLTQSDNRKIHFFFIDYQRQNQTGPEGLLQSDYLNAAASFFNDEKVFKNDTDAIYVVLTKSDLMGSPREKWVEGAKEYIKTHNFISFTNTLKNICKQNHINGGKLYVEPFSIGDVYFKGICSYDDTSANRILQILKDRIRAKGSSILDVFNQ